jgi:hypothetical protein
MVQESVSASVLPIFKISPLLFSLIYSMAGSGYDRRWKKQKGLYQDAIEELEDDWQARNIATYINDRTFTRDILVTGFVYAAIVHLLEFNRSELFMIHATMFFVMAILASRLVNRWFKTDPDSRNPDRYYKAYYTNEKIGEQTEKSYINFSESIERRLSPRRAALFANLLFIVSILGIEYLDTRPAIMVSFLIIVLIGLTGVLTTRIRRPNLF